LTVLNSPPTQSDVPSEASPQTGASKDTDSDVSAPVVALKENKLVRFRVVVRAASCTRVKSPPANIV
jgi:hypothetical protein